MYFNLFTRTFVMIAMEAYEFPKLMPTTGTELDGTTGRVGSPFGTGSLDIFKSTAE